jgi:hypothetical protein
MTDFGDELPIREAAPDWLFWICSARFPHAGYQQIPFPLWPFAMRLVRKSWGMSFPHEGQA